MAIDTRQGIANIKLVTGLAATGTAQADAYPLTENARFEFLTVPAGTGVRLPKYETTHIEPPSITLVNSGANAMQIYPPPGGTINLGTLNSPFSLSPNSGASFWAASPLSWYPTITSAQGGAGLPGGSPGQLQVNNGSSFGGITAGGDGTINTSTGAMTITKTNGSPFAASAIVDTTIASNITTGPLALAILAPIPPHDVLANVTASTAAPTAVTLSSLIDSAIGAAQGNILFRGASAWSALPPGLNTQFLQSGGASANPAWATPGGGGLPGGTSGQIQYNNGGAFGGFTAGGDIVINTATGAGRVASILTPTAIQTGAYTASVGDDVKASTASGGVTVTLPLAPPDRSIIAVAMVAQSGTNALSVATGGGDVFSVASGPTTLVLPYLFQRKVFQYQATGAIWNIIGSYDACTDAGNYVSAQSFWGNVPVAMTNLAYVNITSISLSPGDWDVTGTINLNITAGTITDFKGREADKLNWFWKLVKIQISNIHLPRLPA